ncbi:hypothetical protein PENSPDRAFT_686343 [Peniophora sp. CONT]|nr:hypothetical protein PENSPDRAFT_686343 [Peniophora sp. CONT]
MRRPVLLSKTLDPVLGVFTGLLAYYLHETNPRTAPPPDQTLNSLVGWRMEKRRQDQLKRDQEAETGDWKQVVGEAK